MTLLIRTLPLIAALMLAACSSDIQPARTSSQPSFYTHLNKEGAQVDAAMAASMISGYRANNGRGEVVPDAALMAVARQKAEAMARADSVAAGSGGFSAGVENTSAGYLTLAEAFSGWRDSPPHKANMLQANARKIGIATAYRPGSKYRVFWALVLAP